MRNILLILGREITVAVKRKSFIIMTLLAPVFFALMFVIPIVMMNFDSDIEYKVGVIDESGKMADLLESSETLKYIDLPATDTQNLLSVIQDSSLSACLVIDTGIINYGGSATLYSKKALGMELPGRIKSGLQRVVESERISVENIPQLNEIFDRIKAKVPLRTVTLTEKGQAQEGNTTLNTIISYVVGFVTYMLILIGSQVVMHGVIEDKNSRVVEVLVSSAKSFQLMMGKLLGVGFVFLIQLVLWGIFTAILVGVAAVVISSMGLLGSAHEAANMASQMSAFSLDGIAAATGISLESINFGAIIGTFLLYFFLGYFLYAAMMAAVGTTVESSADAGQMTTPITMPLIIGFFGMMATFKAPEGAVSFWMSMIPFTSPVVMPVRMVYGVPAWQLIVSALLLLVTFIFTTWIASRIFRQGLLRYGKKYGWKDVLKWLKMKS